MNMLLVLTLTAFGDWSYTGFVADPAPSHGPAKLPAAPASRPVVQPTPPEAKQEAPPARMEPNTKLPAAAERAAASSPPQRWRLADAAGQVWEFHDPEKLKDWVRARNAPVSPPSLPPAQLPTQSFLVLPPPMFSTGSNCASGQCFRP